MTRPKAVVLAKMQCERLVDAGAAGAERQGKGRGRAAENTFFDPRRTRRGAENTKGEAGPSRSLRGDGGEVGMATRGKGKGDLEIQRDGSQRQGQHDKR